MLRTELIRQELIKRELAKRNFTLFMQYMHPDISLDRFHKAYYEILNRFAHGHVRKLIITCPPQSGKLLQKDTPVLTANRGWVSHGDLQVGDYVFSPEGKPVQVLWNSGVYEWECRNVEFAEGYSLIASFNHEWGVTIPNSDHKPVFYDRMETDAIKGYLPHSTPYITACTADLSAYISSQYIPDSNKHFIHSILDVGKVLGNCIQVEGGYYLAGEQLIPTHNSEGSTRNLPAYLHGINNNLRICIASYGFPLAEGFNRAIKANIASTKYSNIFPDTVLSKTEQAKKYKGAYDPAIYVNNARTYRLINKEGSLIAVGRGGALTGNPVDIGIVDDLYKDDTEGNSPLIRDAAWNWYVDVFSTRLHNDSQQLITFTRWHEDDIIGRLKELCFKEKTPFYEITSMDQLNNCDPRAWYIINFEAIKESVATDIDPREPGEALWPEKHSIERLNEQRKLDPARFQSLYQGNPMPVEGLLYTRPFRTYIEIPEINKGTYLYCDVADKGSDYLCSIAAVKGMDNKLYVRDIVYTQEGTEVTEELVARQIMRNKVKTAWIEANSGGAIFARNVRSILATNNYTCYIYDVSNTSNKESRVLTNAVDVMEHVVFKEDWAFDYPEFYRDVVGFRKLFKANAHDDAVDSLSEIVSQTVLGKSAMFMYE